MDLSFIYIIFWFLVLFIPMILGFVIGWVSKKSESSDKNL